jgi:hypothetical protein
MLKSRYDFREKRRSENRPTLNRVNEFISVLSIVGVWGGVVVKALRYKLAGRGFDSVYVEQPNRTVLLCECLKA